MKIKYLTILILFIILTPSLGYAFYIHTIANIYPYGNTYTYIIYRDFGFNNQFINYSEYIIYKFSYPKHGEFNIIVTEAEQQYKVVIFLNNYSVKSVNYIYNNSIKLNANINEYENLYIPFLNDLNLNKIVLLSYNFTKIGTSIIYIPALGKVNAICLVSKEKGTIGPSNYNLSIIYYYSTNGLLLKSEYLWSSEGPTGRYFRNVTSVLINIKNSNSLLQFLNF